MSLDIEAATAARFHGRDIMGIELKNLRPDAHCDLNRMFRMMDKLPILMAYIVERFMEEHDETEVGYLLGPLEGELDACLSDLERHARALEATWGRLVLTIEDFFSREWIRLLVTRARDDPRFAAIFDRFLGMKTKHGLGRLVITKLYVRPGWEKWHCVPALVEAATVRGQEIAILRA